MGSIFKKLIKAVIPNYLKLSYGAWKIQAIEFNHLNSIKRKMCVDKDNNPIPWYTYPAISYLDQLDITDKSVFEYSCGYSSLYWAKNSLKIISVEHNKEWKEKIQVLAPKNLTLISAVPPDYVSTINSFDEKFDIIIIDGIERRKCATLAIQKIKNDGLIIVDNSDWYPDTLEFLAKSGLIQIDFIGFGPINRYTWATSFFMKKDFFPKKKNRIQIIGGINHIAEDDKLFHQ
jgi:hypothetical protein